MVLVVGAFLVILSFLKEHESVVHIMCCCCPESVRDRFTKTIERVRVVCLLVSLVVG